MEPIMENQEVVKKTRKPNLWLEFVKTFREEHPELQYKEVLKQAKDKYKPVEKILERSKRKPKKAADISE